MKRAVIVLAGVLVVIACTTIATHRTNRGTDKRTRYWIDPNARIWYWTDQPTWHWTDQETGEQVKILASRTIHTIPTTTPDRSMLIGQDDHLSHRP
jgi:hypothetical protein